jgi:hypothetical protein
MSAWAIEQVITLAEAHYSGLVDVDVEIRELITSAAKRPVARPELATRLARGHCAALRAAYVLATIFQAPPGHCPCDVCGCPTGHGCELCSIRGRAGARAEPLCSLCEDDGYSCLLCEHGELALGPGAEGPGHSGGPGAGGPGHSE